MGIFVLIEAACGLWGLKGASGLARSTGTLGIKTSKAAISDAEAAKAQRRGIESDGEGMGGKGGSEKDNRRIGWVTKKMNEGQQGGLVWDERGLC